MASTQGRSSVPGRADVLSIGLRGDVKAKSQETCMGASAVGQTHSSDETGESRWSEGVWAQNVFFVANTKSTGGSGKVENSYGELRRLSESHTKMQTLMHYVTVKT